MINDLIKKKSQIKKSNKKKSYLSLSTDYTNNFFGQS
jgi:hypothetical protein